MTSDLEALCSSFDHERAQTLVTLLVTWRGTCPGEYQVEIRYLTVCDERLLAADLPVGPVKLCSGLNPCHIGAGPRLRHRVSPDLLPRHHRDEEPLLLFRRAPLIQRLGYEMARDHNFRTRRCDSSDLFYCNDHGAKITDQ